MAFSAIQKVQASMALEVEPSVEQVAKSWDMDAFKLVATPALIATQTPEAWDATFKAYADKLGGAKSFGLGATSGSSSNTNNGVNTASATVTYPVEFEKGSGTIQVAAVKDGGKWHFDSFVVKSPALP